MIYFKTIDFFLIAKLQHSRLNIDCENETEFSLEFYWKKETIFSHKWL